MATNLLGIGSEGIDCGLRRGAVVGKSRVVDGVT